MGEAVFQLLSWCAMREWWTTTGRLIRNHTKGRVAKLCSYRQYLFGDKQADLQIGTEAHTKFIRHKQLQFLRICYITSLSLRKLELQNNAMEPKCKLLLKLSLWPCTTFAQINPYPRRCFLNYSILHWLIPQVIIYAQPESINGVLCIKCCNLKLIYQSPVWKLILQNCNMAIWHELKWKTKLQNYSNFFQSWITK